MKTKFQPYEAHLQYILQWMVDYNLFGCGYINCQSAYFRSPVPKYEEPGIASHLWHDRSIPPEYLVKEDELPRVSHCSIEVDICVQDILNRREVQPRLLHHDFVEFLNPVSTDEKLVHSMAGLWRDETRRRKSRMVDPDPGSSPFPPEVLIPMSADPRSSQKTEWIHEEEYRDIIKNLILDERQNSTEADLSMDKYVQRTQSELSVNTVLESVEDLYPGHVALAEDQMAMGLRGANTISEKDGLHLDIKGMVDYDILDEAIVYSNDVDDGHIQALPGGGAGDSPTEELAGGQLDQPISNSPHPTLLPAVQQVGTKRGGPQFEQGSEQRKRQRLLLGRYDYPSALEKPSAGGTVTSEASNPLHVLHSSALADGCRSGPESPLDPSAKGLVATSRQVVSDGSLISATGSNRAGKAGSMFRGFPVVKDPHDPNTILRLSQGSPSARAASTIVSKDPYSQVDVASLSANTVDPRATSSMPKNVEPGALRHMGLPTTKSWLETTNAYSESPPTASYVISTMDSYGLAPVLYQDPFYGIEADVPDRPREWAGREFKLESLSTAFLPTFNAYGTPSQLCGPKLSDTFRDDYTFMHRATRSKLRCWEIGEVPPSTKEVAAWLQAETAQARSPISAAPGVLTEGEDSKAILSQIDGPTQKHQHGFKYAQQLKSSTVQFEAQYMSIMSLEVHVNTRGNFVPNPEEDEVQAVFWCLQTDQGTVESGQAPKGQAGVVIMSDNHNRARDVERDISIEVQVESSELDLLLRIAEIVRKSDPDILTGYEVHGSSWGYLIERARLKYDYNLCDEFSRMRSQSHGRFGKENDRWGFNNTSTIRVTGRHMINIWRAMRSELNLLQYTLENVAFHLLNRRIPHYSWRDLTRWYTGGKVGGFSKVLHYYISRARLDLDILDHNELVSRTSEQARLLGVDFFSVFSRGSQFKVESLMFRIAKAENFILVSPSRKQVGQQNALECLPLVMEPQSGFYNSPLLVLDFQSLYPSIIIAYNYCYSTFLGRIVNWRGTSKMGFTEYQRQERLLELLKDHVNVAPNGIMYAKSAVRKSLLAKMLSEILETRVMVKSGMKVDKEDKHLQRLLNNRQLALKLIANVTYGYTSASFSGRMPCSEIADSIVQTARETLEKAIALIHSVKRWGAEVVYGDTDSLFVYLKGRTKDQAFDIGQEIAKMVTEINPRPIKLKFEKVYLPSVLLAKKRYVGFKYESRDQLEPEFDAKGIETVRRDGTPAEQKIEERALKILFRTTDLSEVKQYFQSQCEKIMKGSVSIQDFCFAKEVKLGTYSENGLPPPGALISTRRMMEDTRAEPQYGERVPYVVVTGAPRARLIDRCVAPETLLNSDHLELDAEYYITKNLIPPLERIFNLVGANVRRWYDEMPKYQRVRRIDASVPTYDTNQGATSKKTLESYMKSSSCIVCKERLETVDGICSGCLANQATSILALRRRLSRVETRFRDLEKICRSCSGLPWLDEVRCDSKDCPVFYSRVRQRALLQNEQAAVGSILKLLESVPDPVEAYQW
jgi:DNA polymerase zeta